MSTASDPTQAAPAAPTSPPAATPPPVVTQAPPAATFARSRSGRRAGIALAIAMGLIAAFVGVRYVKFRLGHSITEDAFIESHLVNLSTQTVSGHLIRYLVDEND